MPDVRATPPSTLDQLSELALVFVRLGLTAFGGPAVHIALMEDEIVRRRGWLSREAFLELFGATNLLPGPNSTEMALHIGHQRAGLAGMMTAGFAFIVPPALITVLLAALYVRWGALPLARGLLYGLDPVVLVVVAVALGRLAPGTLRSPAAWIAGVAACAGALAGVHELLLLLAGALVVGAGALGRRLASRSTPLAVSLPAAIGLSAAGAVPAGIATTTGVFLFFLKVGSVLYGSGYVLLAFLRAELVERRAWLTDAQLLDAIAVGQFTPGPLFTTATFVGYLLRGGAGATAATVGIFAPAFVFVAVSGPLVRLLRSSPIAQSLLQGVTAASVGLMAAVWWQLAGAALVDLPALGIAAATGIALALRINPAWCLLIGALAGLLLRR